MPTFQYDNPDIVEDSGNNVSIPATSSEKLWETVKTNVSWTIETINPHTPKFFDGSDRHS